MLTPLLSFTTLHNIDPSSPPTDGQLADLVNLTILKLMSWATIAALVICLPLYLVGTSCLGSSIPANPLGGRFGTLNDISMLRLLTTLGSGELPSPSKRSAVLVRRAEDTLSSIDARNRLIILLVLVVIIIVLPTVWTLRWTLHGLQSYQKKWKEEICSGEEVVWLPLPQGKELAPPAAEILEMAAQPKTTEGKPTEFSIRQVFAIP